jgi:hypothetical protein
VTDFSFLHPIQSLIFLSQFNNNVHTDCFRALAIVQFLVWSFNSETAIAAIDFLLATQPPKDVVMANLDVLAKTTCGMNGQFLVFDTVFPYETKIFVAAVVFAVIFWCLAIAVLYKNRFVSTFYFVCRKFIF